MHLFPGRSPGFQGNSLAIQINPVTHGIPGFRSLTLSFDINLIIGQASWYYTRERDGVFQT